MSSKEQILKLVKEGVISVEEGIKLLEALHATTAPASIVPKPSQMTPNPKKMLRVTVDSADGDKVRVNVPISLIKAGVNLSNQFNVNGQPLDMKGLDIDMIMQAIEEGATGEIVNVESADGDSVKVFVD
ncbi:MAG TPA: hypothetical protein DEA51_02995 [Erysipelotrichaceae bacterium]|nr:hypothetical protein [Erysipelotrichaceae bacterium]